MKINGRLLLLLAAIGLFVRVWNVNDRQGARLSAGPRLRIVQTIPVRDSAPRVVRTSLVGNDQPAHASAPAVEEAWTLETAPVVLPEPIPAGTYRVVSDSGRVASLQVPDDYSAARGASIDIVSWTVEGVRWHLIRLNTRAVPERVALADVDEIARFSEQSRPTPAGEDSARPLPPALPTQD